MAYSKNRFTRASGAQIAERTRPVYVCNACDVINDPVRKGKGYRCPDECKYCGFLAFTKFDSTGECGRWNQLRILQDRGKITDLERQVRFPLFAYRPDDGAQVLVGHYVADHVYKRDGERVIEDYKGGAVTDLFDWKARHMKAQGTPVTTYKGA